MNKGPNATIRLVRRQNHAGTTVSWTTVQREKNSHAYKLSSNVQTACSTDSLNNCPKHSILRFSSFALKIYLWLKMCQHNLPCSIVLPTACFMEGPSPHFTLCSFWRRRPRLEAVSNRQTKACPFFVLSKMYIHIIIRDFRTGNIDKYKYELLRSHIKRIFIRYCIRGFLTCCNGLSLFAPW